MRKGYMHPFSSKFVSVVPLKLRGIITMYCMNKKIAIAQLIYLL